MIAKVASRGADQFMVRFPDGMRDRIAREAARNGRSMNSEILHRLQQSLDGDDRLVNQTRDEYFALEERIDRLLAKLDSLPEPAPAKEKARR